MEFDEEMMDENNFTSGNRTIQAVADSNNQTYDRYQQVE
jgi:hypothetical protein